MSRVTDEPCHACWISHATYADKSFGATEKRHVTHVNEPCHIRRHVTQDEPCHRRAVSRMFDTSRHICGQVTWSYRKTSRHTSGRPVSHMRTSHTHTDTHIRTHAHTRTHTHSFSLTHTHAHTHTHTRVHTCTVLLGDLLSPLEVSDLHSGLFVYLCVVSFTCSVFHV